MQPLKPRTIVMANTDINSPRRTRSTQRGEAATEFRIISRKDAKAAKKKKKYLSELSVLGALAGGISESEMFRILENSPKPRKFSSIVVRRHQNHGVLEWWSIGVLGFENIITPSLQHSVGPL